MRATLLACRFAASPPRPCYSVNFPPVRIATLLLGCKKWTSNHLPSSPSHFTDIQFISHPTHTSYPLGPHRPRQRRPIVSRKHATNSSNSSLHPCSRCPYTQAIHSPNRSFTAPQDDSISSPTLLPNMERSRPCTSTSNDSVRKPRDLFFQDATPHGNHLRHSFSRLHVQLTASHPIIRASLKPSPTTTHPHATTHAPLWLVSEYNAIHFPTLHTHIRTISTNTPPKMNRRTLAHHHPRQCSV